MSATAEDIVFGHREISVDTVTFPRGITAELRPEIIVVIGNDGDGNMEMHRVFLWKKEALALARAVIDKYGGGDE